MGIFEESRKRFYQSLESEVPNDDLLDNESEELEDDEYYNDEDDDENVHQESLESSLSELRSIREDISLARSIQISLESGIKSRGLRPEITRNLLTQIDYLANKNKIILNNKSISLESISDPYKRLDVLEYSIESVSGLLGKMADRFSKITENITDRLRQFKNKLGVEKSLSKKLRVQLSKAEFKDDWEAKVINDKSIVNDVGINGEVSFKNCEKLINNVKLISSESSKISKSTVDKLIPLVIEAKTPQEIAKVVKKGLELPSSFASRTETGYVLKLDLPGDYKFRRSMPGELVDDSYKSINGYLKRIVSDKGSRQFKRAGKESELRTLSKSEIKSLLNNIDSLLDAGISAYNSNSEVWDKINNAVNKTARVTGKKLEVRMDENVGYSTTRDIVDYDVVKDAVDIAYNYTDVTAELEFAIFQMTARLAGGLNRLAKASIPKS